MFWQALIFSILFLEGNNVANASRNRFLKEFIKKKFSHPLSRGLDIDSARAVSVHRRIIKENKLLSDYYKFVYSYFKKIEVSLSYLDYPSLEIGSGAGFLKDFLPNVITSDIVSAEGVDRLEDAMSLSFSDCSLKAVYSNGVLHHIKDPKRFLSEVQRVLVPGGVFVCNEPSSTIFGYFMNKNFHHENTDRSVLDWQVDEKSQSQRLTKANMAMPYIIFKRDAELFRKSFPRLKISSIIEHDFLRYTLSGGLSYKPFIPEFCFCFVNYLEILMRPFMRILGNEMFVTVQKI